MSKELGRSRAEQGRVGRAMRGHPLFSYFSIAYAIKFILLIPYTLAAWGVISGNWEAAFVLATFGPFAAGLIMAYVTEGKDGVYRLRDRVRRWRVGWPWLLISFAAIPLVVMLGVVVQPGALSSFTPANPGVVAVSYLVNYVAIWFGGGGLDEEVGWRGYALPVMQPRYGPLWGTLFLGLMHCFWHLEEFLTPAQGGGPGTGWTPLVVILPMFLVLVISVNIILTWLFNHTKGSLFVAISAHASVNAPQVALIPLFPAVGVFGLSAGYTLGMGVLALLILILTRGRLGYRPAPLPTIASAETEIRGTAAQPATGGRRRMTDRLPRMLMVIVVIAMLGLGSLSVSWLTLPLLVASELALLCFLIGLVWIARARGGGKTASKG